MRQHTGLNLSSMPGRRHRASAGPMRRERRALRAIGALLALPAASADLRVIPEGYCAAPTIERKAWVKSGEDFGGTMFAFGPFLTGETRDDGMAKGKCFVRTEAWENYAECTTHCAGAFAEPIVARQPMPRQSDVVRRRVVHVLPQRRPDVVIVTGE